MTADRKPLLRYEPQAKYIGTGDYLAEMVSDPDGEWILYVDHLAERAKLLSRYEEAIRLHGQQIEGCGCGLPKPCDLASILEAIASDPDNINVNALIAGLIERGEKMQRREWMPSEQELENDHAMDGCIQFENCPEAMKRHYQTGLRAQIEVLERLASMSVPMIHPDDPTRYIVSGVQKAAILDEIAALRKELGCERHDNASGL